MKSHINYCIRHNLRKTKYKEIAQVIVEFQGELLGEMDVRELQEKTPKHSKLSFSNLFSLYLCLYSFFVD